MTTVEYSPRIYSHVLTMSKDNTLTLIDTRKYETVLVRDAVVTHVLNEIFVGMVLINSADHFVTFCIDLSSCRQIACLMRMVSGVSLTVAHFYPIYYLSNDGHPAIAQACFSPDGCHVAAGSSDGSVVVWNANTGAIEKIFTSKGSAVPNPIAGVTWGRNLGLVACDKVGKLNVWR